MFGKRHCVLKGEASYYKLSAGLVMISRTEDHANNCFATISLPTPGYYGSLVVYTFVSDSVTKLATTVIYHRPKLMHHTQVS